MSNMRMALLLIVFIWTLSACTSSEEREKEKYARVVEEWMGKRISLPEDMTDVLSGDMIDLREADFVILTYIDSLGCTGCKMRLPLWNEFIESIDDVTDADVRTLMIVHPKDEKELNYILKRDAYDAPVYFDRSNQVCRSNSFPDDPMLQTFLLDKSGQVIAIGNPAVNTGVANLYRSIVSGRKTVIPDGKAVVELDKGKYYVGRMSPAQETSFAATLTNNGNDTVRIRSIISSCDCITYKADGAYISPGTSLKVRVNVKADSILGGFDRTLHVFYEGSESPSVIHIFGIVDNNE